MNNPIKPLAFSLSALLMQLPCAADLFPNGDFENAGTSWSETPNGGSADFTFSYPNAGGNQDGYGIIDHTVDNDNFGIWVGNGGEALTLSSLGLTADTTYNFTQDMILLSGSNIGGVKLEFYDNAGGVTNAPTDMRPALIGDGSTWETYTFESYIPAGTVSLKVVPVWGRFSSTGFDNIGFDPTPILPPVEPPVVVPDGEPQVATGTLVSWVPTNTDKSHQPQSSLDETTWTDLGPAFLGTDTTTILDPNSAPFHRVLEKEPAGEQALINGDFEIVDPGDSDCPESWSCLGDDGNVIAERIETDSFSGSASVRLAVTNETDASPKSAILKQELGIVGGSVTPGESYTFSFRAKQISHGISYVQNYKLVWFNDSGVMPGQDVGPNGFPNGTGNWDEISLSGVIAPAGATSVQVEIVGSTGADSGDNFKGEVLIDDVSLSVGTASAPTNLATTTEPGIGITAQTQSGVTYKAQQSEDLQTFTDLTGTFIGNGQIIGAGIPDGGPSHFFRIHEVPAVAP